MAHHIYRPSEPYHDPSDALDDALDTLPSSTENPVAYLDCLVAANDIGTDERDAGVILYGMTWRADLPGARQSAMTIYPWRDKAGKWADQRCVRSVLQERVKDALASIRSDRRREEVKRFILRRPLEDTTAQLSLGLWDVSRAWWPSHQATYQRNGITLVGRDPAAVAQVAANDNAPARRAVASPLDTLLARGVITDTQHTAGQRYYSDWYHAGLSGIGAIDYSAANGAGAGSAPHMMPLTGLMALKRAEHRKARAALADQERAVLEAVVLEERSFTEAAKDATGIRNKQPALREGKRLLSAALSALERHYGLTNVRAA